MNYRTGLLKDFDSRIEVMGLNCPCGNAEGIKFDDLVSHGQTLVCVGMLLLAASIGTYILQAIVPLYELGSGHTRL